jgi:hypothetical protein
MEKENKQTSSRRSTSSSKLTRVYDLIDAVRMGVPEGHLVARMREQFATSADLARLAGE